LLIPAKVNAITVQLCSRGLARPIKKRIRKQPTKPARKGEAIEKDRDQADLNTSTDISSVTDLFPFSFLF
jgi:hypothetical protein